MSRMVRFHAFGGAEVLKLEEVAVPAPGIGEVRIAVQAIGLNRADALWRENLYIEDATLPAGLGNEAAGVVEAVGEGVEGLGVGDRVAVLPGASQGLYPTYGDRILFRPRTWCGIPTTCRLRRLRVPTWRISRATSRCSRWRGCSAVR
ncbi:alcohol dehydrogenase catalytic domain-containing protein [Variovorax boronicumulans]|uniref:alcohol dehydrogenase catalytic domain-containing protein n=1 Tax=Variovorax boronicumulans TaxID=436515 RepID=UPI0036F357AE